MVVVRTILGSCDLSDLENTLIKLSNLEGDVISVTYRDPHWVIIIRQRR